HRAQAGCARMALGPGAPAARSRRTRRLLRADVLCLCLSARTRLAGRGRLTAARLRRARRRGTLTAGRRLLALAGRHHQVHDAALGARLDLDPAVVRELGRDAGQLAAAEVLVRHLASTEAQRELDALALAQELLRLLQLPLEVVRVGARADPQLLELRDVLLLLRLGVFLLLRV